MSTYDWKQIRMTPNIFPKQSSYNKESHKEKATNEKYLVRFDQLSITNTRTTCITCALKILVLMYTFFYIRQRGRHRQTNKHERAITDFDLAVLSHQTRKNLRQQLCGADVSQSRLGSRRLCDWLRRGSTAGFGNVSREGRERILRQSESESWNFILLLSSSLPQILCQAEEVRLGYVWRLRLRKSDTHTHTHAHTINSIIHSILHPPNSQTVPRVSMGVPCSSKPRGSHSMGDSRHTPQAKLPSFPPPGGRCEANPVWPQTHSDSHPLPRTSPPLCSSSAAWAR